MSYHADHLTFFWGAWMERAQVLYYLIGTGQKTSKTTFPGKAKMILG